MARFLITYHGGGMPEGADAQQQAMAAFGAWVARAGAALTDPGAPLGPSRTVSADAVTEGPAAGAIGGYSLVEAPDLAAAVDLVRDHPFVSRGGSLQVSEAISPP